MRVLVAEDDRASRNLLSRILAGWGYEVSAVSDGLEAWAELQGPDPPPLVVLDWMMPGLDGVEVCRLARAVPTPSPPYIILLTARSGKEDIVVGLEAGADDFVSKPFDRDELRARVEVGRRFVELNRELVESRRALEIQARVDALTGAMNRRAIVDTLEVATARADRLREPLAVGMMDIDYFKRINDTYGHVAGDEVLKEVVGRTRASIRPYDSLGRFGGEEFLVIMPGSGVRSTRSILERVRIAVCSVPVPAGSVGIAVTVSIGGTVKGEESLDHLLRVADDALYRAKAKGRNRVVMLAAPRGDRSPVSVVAGRP
jgi:diguanylate cyclase (GGDEF)-like protein